VGRAGPRTLIFDTGALLGLERGDRRLAALLAEIAAAGGETVIPAAVLAQAWRGGRRSARLGQLLRTRGVDVVALGRVEAKAAGELCGVAQTADVVDASVVLAARGRAPAVVVTSDPGDLRRLDPALRIVAL
jgi:hypothetical protein